MSGSGERRAEKGVLLVALLVAFAGCGDSHSLRPDPGGDTRQTVYADRDGDGVLEVHAGERPVARTELAPASALGPELPPNAPSMSPP